MTGSHNAIGIGSMVWAVRPATDEDAVAVRAVAVVAWRDTYTGILRPETIESFFAGPYAIGNVRARIAQQDVLVIEAGLEIVAYAAAIPEVDRLFLDAIYVLPGRQRRGAGRALLDRLASRHRRSPIEAHVLLGNRKGEPFYERCGFTPIRRLEGSLMGESITERMWRRPAEASET